VGFFPGGEMSAHGVVVIGFYAVLVYLLYRSWR